MAEESKNIALAILGIVAVIAIIGLILMFAKMKETGAGTYSGGKDPGIAIQKLTDERLLQAGTVQFYNMPQDEQRGQGTVGSWRLGPRKRGTAEGTFEPRPLTINGNVRIVGCYDLNSLAMTDPAFAVFKDYTKRSSVQQAISVFGSDCLDLIVNGNKPIAGVCCNEKANILPGGKSQKI